MSACRPTVWSTKPSAAAAANWSATDMHLRTPHTIYVTPTVCHAQVVFQSPPEPEPPFAAGVVPSLSWHLDVISEEMSAAAGALIQRGRPSLEPLPKPPETYAQARRWSCWRLSVSVSTPSPRATSDCPAGFTSS